MRVFLKFLDERVWMSIIDMWSKDDLNACNWNSKGLHVIFMVVSQEESKIISANDPWDILEVTHEGIKIVKNSKLQMWTSRFEEMRIKGMKLLMSFLCSIE
jgi:hypothetical protein